MKSIFRLAAISIMILILVSGCNALPVGDWAKDGKTLKIAIGPDPDHLLFLIAQYHPLSGLWEVCIGDLSEMVSGNYENISTHYSNPQGSILIRA